MTSSFLEADKQKGFLSGTLKNPFLVSKMCQTLKIPRSNPQGETSFVKSGSDYVRRLSRQSKPRHSTKPAKRQYSALEKAQYRQRQGLKMSKRLFISAQMNQDAETMARADCIAETASSENLYHSVDQVNYETGECYEGYGTLTETVASRLCPSYLAKCSKQQRREKREDLARVKPKQFDLLRFITLTMPNLQTDFKTTFEILFRAFSLLKKREIFTKNVTGAIYGHETTVGAENHHHSHIHILAWSRWINQTELSKVWTDCVEKACAEIGVKCLVNTSHGRMIVDIRLARKKATGRGTIAIEAALQEVCKYLTKGSAFDKLPIKQLSEIGKALKGRKLVGSYGECNVRKGRAKAVQMSETKPESTAFTSLDKTETNDGRKIKVKRETVVEVGTRMILAGKRAEFRRWLKRKMDERRAFRKRQLALLYPGATFYTLSGAAWSADDYLSKIPSENVVYLQDWGKVRA